MLTIIFVILAIVLIVVAIGLFLLSVPKYDPSTGELGAAGGGKIVTGIVLLVLAGLSFFIGLGWKEIGPGQVGVKTRFGQVQEGTVQPGLFWLMPFVENIVIYDGRAQSYIFDALEGATSDLQAVHLTGQVIFHIDPTAADKILQEVGGPGDYVQKVLVTQANTALKEQTPNYTAQAITAKRDEIGQAVTLALDERLAQYHLVVDRVSVSNVGLDAEFMDSVEKKQIAQQDLARAGFEAQTAKQLAEGEANAAIERAEGEAEVIRLRAAAQAEANDAINASLTEDLLQWQAIQRLSDKVRVMLLPSEQGIIFDLKGLQEEPAQ